MERNAAGNAFSAEIYSQFPIHVDTLDNPCLQQDYLLLFNYQLSISPTRKDMADSFQDAVAQFVELWGEMANQWGISKSMAQIYALLYAHTQPMDTQQIMQALDISRGNANINIHKLVEWQLLHKAEMPDTRRDYYVAEKNILHLVLRIIEERRKRELMPLAARIAAIAQNIDSPPPSSEEATLKKNLQDMAEFIEIFNEITELALPLLQMKDAERIHQLLLKLKD
jgi:DNA-binding transcriptional regulator GbsR (MarR family)